MPSETAGLGILLYAETSNSHRIAATTMLEITSEVEEATLFDEIKTRGVEVVRKLNKQLVQGGVVDEHLIDQIIIFMALACSGISPFGVIARDTAEDTSSRCEILVGEVSSHTQAAMRIAQIILRDIAFSIKRLENDKIIITCTKKS